MHVFIIPKTKSETSETDPSRSTVIRDAIISTKIPLGQIAGKENMEASKQDTIIIDPLLKKKDGTPVTRNDLPDSLNNRGFGNGITALGKGLRIKNGEHIPVVFFVFENAVGITLDQLRTAEKA